MYKCEDFEKRKTHGEETATHSSSLAWEISWTEEPVGLQSMGSRMSQAWLKKRQGIFEGVDSPRKAQALTKGLRALAGRARTVAEDSQLPGLLILTSRPSYARGKLESKISLRASLVALWFRICLPMQEIRGLGFDPWVGKITQSTERLSPYAAATEPAPWSPGATATEPTAATTEARVLWRQKEPPRWEDPAPQLESSPCLLQLETRSSSNKDPAQPKIK